MEIISPLRYETLMKKSRSDLAHLCLVLADLQTKERDAINRLFDVQNVVDDIVALTPNMDGNGNRFWDVFKPQDLQECNAYEETLIARGETPGEAVLLAIKALKVD